MIAVLAALVILDLAVLGTGLGGLFGVGVGAVLIAHALLGIAAYGVWLRRGGAMGLAPAILGAVGPVGLLLGVLLHRRRVRDAAPADGDAVFGPMPTSHRHRGAMLAVARMLDGRVHHGGPETAHSLVTVMRHGDVAERRRALETVVRSFQPALSPLVALALTDGDQTIRALAAAASARVVQNLALSRAAIEAGLADGSDPEAHTTLALLLADHARSNVLLSDSQRAHLRADADAVAILATDDDSRHADARIEALWAAGDYAAIDRLATTMPDAYAERDGDTATGLAWWRAESVA